MEEVGEAEEGDENNVGGDGGCFEEGGEIFEVDLDDAYKQVDPGFEGSVPDDILGEALHGDCFESVDGFFAEPCSYWMSERGE